MVHQRIGQARRTPRPVGVTLAIIVILLLIGVRTLASYSIEYAWWSELGQLSRRPGEGHDVYRVKRTSDGNQAPGSWR